MRASTGALISSSLHPARILTVTGMLTARAMAADDRGGMARVAHQRAAGVVLRDLRHRAAHVDVDDVGAHALDDAGSISHLCGIAAEDLDGDRPFFLGVLGVLERAVDAPDEPFGADHLGDDQTAAPLALHQAAKRGVGHAGHRRDTDGRGERDLADLRRRCGQARWPRRRLARLVCGGRGRAHCEAPGRAAAACPLASSAASAFAASTTPVSNAALRDGLFHSMMACARRRSRYLSTSPARR